MIAGVGATRSSPAEREAARQSEPRRQRPAGTNPVILALVVALRDVESRRARGNVLTDPTAKEQTP
jgi:hypothetical protein